MAYFATADDRWKAHLLLGNGKDAVVWCCNLERLVKLAAAIVIVHAKVRALVLSLEVSQRMHDPLELLTTHRRQFAEHVDGRRRVERRKHRTVKDFARNPITELPGLQLVQWARTLLCLQSFCRQSRTCWVVHVDEGTIGACNRASNISVT